MSRERGFTLPELLVVGVVILVFAGVMLALIHPRDYQGRRDDARRRLDMARIMSAISKYDAENHKLPPTITNEETAISSGDGEASLCSDLVPKYIDDLPTDPKNGIKYVLEETCAAEDQLFVSGYTVRVEGGNVILSALSSESGKTITIEKWFSYL